MKFSNLHAVDTAAVLDGAQLLVLAGEESVSLEAKVSLHGSSVGRSSAGGGSSEVGGGGHHSGSSHNGGHGFRSLALCVREEAEPQEDERSAQQEWWDGMRMIYEERGGSYCHNESLGSHTPKGRR